MALSYIAAQRAFPFYNDMADAKAVLESIARSYGYRYAKSKKVRINTISQSPTPTTAGTGIGGFDAFFEFAEKMSPLGNATADDCANYVITMFSDLTPHGHDAEFVPRWRLLDHRNFRRTDGDDSRKTGLVCRPWILFYTR